MATTADSVKGETVSEGDRDSVAARLVAEELSQHLELRRELQSQVGALQRQNGCLGALVIVLLLAVFLLLRTR